MAGPVPGPLSYLGVRAANPGNITVLTTAPTTATSGNIGDQVVNTTDGSVYELVGISGTTYTWVGLGGGAAGVDTINSNAPVAGNYTLAGTANQIAKADTAGTTTFSLPAAITAPGSLTTTTSLSATTTVTAGTGITATTGNIVASTGNITSTLGSVGAATTVTAGTSMTATLGNITATNGNFVGSTAGTGFLFNANTASGAAPGPVVLNSRAGAVTFTGVSIAAAADLTLTITNSAITGATTQIIYSMKGSTTGSAPSIKSVTNGAGTSAIVVTNGTGATTTTADITLTFLVVN